MGVALPKARTTLELTQASPDATLSEVGMPSREILAFRSQDGISFLELEG